MKHTRSYIAPFNYLFFLLILLSCAAAAQDVIVRTDKTEIKAKVTEVTETIIKYRKWEMQDGPLYNINKSDVFMIIYANGQRETFSAASNDRSNLSNPPNIPAQQKTENLVPAQEDMDNVLRLATTTNFNLADLEYDWRPLKIGKKKDLSIGLGANLTYATDLGVFFYTTAAHRFWLSQGNKTPLKVWGNAGIAATFDASTGDQIGRGSFLWEFGTDIPLGSTGNFGLTVYTPKFQQLFFGIFIGF